jgi:hypothetical protein
MERTKITEVSIDALKVTYEDKWLENYVKKNGDSVSKFPLYLALKGNTTPLKDWSNFRSMSLKYRIENLIDLYKDIIYNGQLEPIKIYKDMRINTGHKRASCMKLMGYKKISAIIVEDDYKL